ncbi:MAG: hypothetical protein ACJ788_20430 [Ktedonobacteraceae bacterium]
MNTIGTSLLQCDSVISYRLLPYQLPINPDRLWRGKILSIGLSIVLVESLEAGYEGLKEFVRFEQIVEIASSSWDGQVFGMHNESHLEQAFRVLQSHCSRLELRSRV